jgi:hypothetical protein
LDNLALDSFLCFLGLPVFSARLGNRQEDKEGGIEVVESEARIVRLILRMLAAGKSPEEIKRHLDAMNLRSRSGNRFTEREIKAMPKPIYAGVIQTRAGRLVKSAYYRPVVSVEILKSGQKALERLSEGLDFVFLALAEGYS